MRDGSEHYVEWGLTPLRVQRRTLAAEEDRDEAVALVRRLVDDAHAMDPDAALEPSIYEACVWLRGKGRKS